MSDAMPRSPQLVCPAPANLNRVVSILNVRLPAERATALEVSALKDLESLGYETDLISALKDLVDDDRSEEEVVAALRSVLAVSPAGERPSRNARRLIRRAERDWRPSEWLLKDVSLLVQGGTLA